jgi:hypothetical protein
MNDDDIIREFIGGCLALHGFREDCPACVAYRDANAALDRLVNDPRPRFCPHCGTSDYPWNCPTACPDSMTRLRAAEAERDALKESNHGRLVAAWDDLASLRDQLQGRFEQIAELEARAEAAEAEVARLRECVQVLEDDHEGENRELQLLNRVEAAEAALRDAQTERDKFRQRAEGIWNFLGPEGQDALIESGWHP